MIDRIDSHPTSDDHNNFEERSGKDRRKIHTMLDPDIVRRKGDRRKRNIENGSKRQLRLVIIPK